MFPGHVSLWRRTVYTSYCQSFCDIQFPQNLIYLSSRPIHGTFDSGQCQPAEQSSMLLWHSCLS
jgi:hypothetical protein